MRGFFIKTYYQFHNIMCMSERQRYLEKVKEEQRQRRIDQYKLAKDNPDLWVLMAKEIRWYNRYILYLESYLESWD